MKYFIVYDPSNAYWCWEEEAHELKRKGWTIYAVTDNERTADELAEKACYVR